MEGTRSVWEKRVEDWRASGLDATSFARKHGLSEASLKWWKWQLSRKRRSRSKKARAKREAISPLTFIEMTPAIVGAALEVVLANGARIRIAPDFDPVVLARLVDVLERRK